MRKCLEIGTIPSPPPVQEGTIIVVSEIAHIGLRFAGLPASTLRGHVPDDYSRCLRYKSSVRRRVGDRLVRERLTRQRRNNASSTRAASE